MKKIIISLAFVLVLTGCVSGQGENKKNTANGVQLDDLSFQNGKTLNSASDVMITEYSDFECPYCEKAVEGVHAMARARPDVQMKFRHFPIPQIHDFAQGAAEAAECTAEQGKFWAMHDEMFANQDDLTDNDLRGYAEKIGADMDRFERCLVNPKTAKKVNAEKRLGVRDGVSGTPTFIVSGPNGTEKLVGAQSIAKFEAAIEKVQ